MIFITVFCFCFFKQIHLDENSHTNNEDTKKSELFMGENKYSSFDEDELAPEEYIIYDELTLSEEADNTTIKSIDEIYGDTIYEVTGLSPEDIVEKYLTATYNTDKVNIISKVNLLDANHANTYVAFNYRLNNGIYGYITISQYLNMILFKENIEGKFLPSEYGELFYLSEGEFYYFNNNRYYTLKNESIESENFYQFLKDRKNGYLNLTYQLLDEIQIDNMVQINNLIYLNQYDLSNQTVGEKTYTGQDKDAYGYGGINDCIKYLEDRYGGSATLSSSKSLDMKNFVMSTFESSANNCTLTAITRVLKYYYDKGYTKIDSSQYDIYRDVKRVAEAYGYTSTKGTGFTKINNIVEDVLEEYGYSKSTCKGIYAWNFSSEVKDEINAGRPVIMNIARGYYGNHTVTVCGYKIYKITKKGIFGNSTKTYNMIEVYDGWSSGKRYIDYKAFAYDLLTSGFGSFNTISMKK